MSDRLDRVGVRELRQNLSVYLRRVKEGETLDVTEHGRVVAQLTPSQEPETGILERLVAEGRASPAKGDLLAYLASNPPLPIKRGPTGTEILLAMREDEADR